jgi:hypothetical protein
VGRPAGMHRFGRRSGASPYLDTRMVPRLAVN